MEFEGRDAASSGETWAEDTTVNAFIEQPFTVYHYGDGVPHWQVFGGRNFQFALGGGATGLPKRRRGADPPR